jgi:hypothetical protein
MAAPSWDKGRDNFPCASDIRSARRLRERYTRSSVAAACVFAKTITSGLPFACRRAERDRTWRLGDFDDDAVFGPGQLNRIHHRSAAAGGLMALPRAARRRPGPLHGEHLCQYCRRQTHSASHGIVATACRPGVRNSPAVAVADVFGAHSRPRRWRPQIPDRLQRNAPLFWSIHEDRRSRPAGRWPAIRHSAAAADVRQAEFALG